MDKQKAPSVGDPAAVKKAGEKARAEVVDQRIVDILLKATAENLILPDPDAEVAKGNTQPPTAWIHGPALLHLLSMADDRLTQSARDDGLNVKQVTRIHARLIEDTQLILLKPASDRDLTAEPVSRYDNYSGAWVNIFSLLGPANLTVESGYRERFDVMYVPRGSALWPGLVIDLNAPKERRALSQKNGTADASTSDQPAEGTVTAKTTRKVSRKATAKAAELSTTTAAAKAVSEPAAPGPDADSAELPDADK